MNQLTYTHSQSAVFTVRQLFCAFLRRYNTLVLLIVGALLSACQNGGPPKHVRLIDVESIAIPLAEPPLTAFQPPDAWNLGNKYMGSPLSALVKREGEITIAASRLFPLILEISSIGFQAPRQHRIDIGWDRKPLRRVVVMPQPRVHQLVVPLWRLQNSNHALSFRSVSERPGQRGRHTGYLLLTDIRQNSRVLKHSMSVDKPLVLSSGEGAMVFLSASQKQWLTLTTRGVDRASAVQTSVLNDRGEACQLEPFTADRTSRTHWLNWSFPKSSTKRQRLTISPERGTVEIALLQMGWDPPLDAAQCMVYRVTKSRPQNPPVVIILLDALRADRWGAVRNGHSLTPNLDMLAQEGVLFNRARCHVPYTSGSLPTILSGCYPRSEETTADDAAWPSLPSLLRAEGYLTVAISANPFLQPGSETAHGFDLVLDIDAWRHGHGISEPSYWGHHFVDPLREMLFQFSDQPYFILLHLMQPHEPYSPPAPFDTLYAALDSGRLGDIEPFAPGRLMQMELTAEEIDYVHARYDANVRYGDYVVGQVLDVLCQYSTGTDPIIVVTADHGEALMEHGALGHMDGRVYEENLVVPLFFGGSDLPAGKNMDAAVELVDIAPTLLDMLEYSGASQMDGASLVNIMNGSAEARPGPFLAVSEAFRNYPLRVALYDSPWKYIATKRHEELYHLESDPTEKKNVASSHQDLCSHFRETCHGWLAGVPPHAVPDSALLSDEERKRLEILGYIAR